ncbi:hypothetical protein WME99_05720 [Sorangium sp. So ce136]|uniref:hypothetical protein n=1 Tax=Sorangium sp. So ce136 TaxID=3133284 RepID=UPI003F020744
MEDELASISLMEHLSEPGFRASVIATYNCYFPFYEEVVLRRLVAAGCTHNVLMMDAARCAEAFASEDLRPRRAGRDYTLIPVEVGGAFHPKILLRVGKSKGALFVGSHNLTLSGFGLNDEVTTVFRAQGASIRGAAAPFRRAFEFLAGHVPSGLPDVVEAHEGLKLGVPWLEGPVAADAGDRAILTSSATGADLWSQIVPRMPRDVATAFVCAPFFDPKLAFARRLLADVRPREAVIGIDPASVDIEPDEAARLPGVRFVNVAGVPNLPHRREDSVHYLHAKVLWFQGADGELLVVGSANPSIAAFLAPPASRNAEAVVADRRVGAGAALGIEALRAAPPVTEADWSFIAERRATQPARVDAPGRKVWIATPTAHGFLAQAPIRAGVVLHGIGEEGAVLGQAVVRGERSETSIEAPEGVRDGAHFLEARSPGDPMLVIVHRTEEIAKNLGGDTRKALRQALGALEEDPGQLETLLKLTEKVIFDSDDVVRTTPLQSTGGASYPTEPSMGPASLAVDAAGPKAGRRRRRLASGDVLVLLDALMRRLGEGLSAAPGLRPPSDQEQIGADEEDGGELAREAPDHEALAKACRGKVRRLIKRMEGQLELAAEPDRARRAVVQLAAVLGVLRALRLIEQRPEWRRKRLELIDRDDAWWLYEAAALALVWGAEPVAQRALAEADGEMFEELSMVVGLLGWLAWEVGLDVEVSSERGGQRGVEDESWVTAQLYALLAPWLAADPEAISILEESVARTPKPRVDGDRWFIVHLGLAERLEEVLADPVRAARPARRPRPGDLVVLAERFSPRVRVVLDVNAIVGDAKVVLFDAGDESGRREFLASKVASLPWEPERSGRVAASA